MNEFRLVVEKPEREYIVTTLNIFFVFMNHLKMAAKRGRNM
jgi:hypothetical protein